MKEKYPEIRNMGERLSRLERMNQRLRRTVVLMAAVLGVAVFAGAMLIEEEVKARCFLLAGSGDRDHGEFAISKDGSPHLVLRDGKGCVRAEFGLEQNGWPVLRYFDATGKAVKTIEVPREKKIVPPPVVPVDTKTSEKTLKVKFTTTMGDFVVELNEKKAPITVKNFLTYVNSKFYDGTIFHRVILNFMIQGGGFTEEMNPYPKQPRAPIKNEASNGLKNLRGTIAMARTNDPDSATSQFFINVVDNPFLDRNPRSAGYAVFGKVVKGMDVVDKIRNTRVRNLGGAFTNAPVKKMVIQSIRVVDQGETDTR